MPRKPKLTPEEQLLIEQRRVVVSDLIAGGLNYRQIVDFLSNPQQAKPFNGEIPYSGRFKCSVGTVSSDVKAIFLALDRLQALPVRQMRRIELERINMMHSAIWPKALDGDLWAQQMVVTLQNQRARYQPSLVAPEEVNHKHTGTTTLEIVYGEPGSERAPEDLDGGDADESSAYPSAEAAPEAASDKETPGEA